MESSGAYGTALVVWFISGLLALCGALCYAELGTMLPMNGGETVYLGRAFGSLVSFMFEFITIIVQKVRNFIVYKKKGDIKPRFSLEVLPSSVLCLVSMCHALHIIPISSIYLTTRMMLLN